MPYTLLCLAAFIWGFWCPAIIFLFPAMLMDYKLNRRQRRVLAAIPPLPEELPCPQNFPAP